MENKLALSVSELAERLSIGINSAYLLVARSDFPSIRIGERKIIIPIDSLNTWLARQTEERREV